MRREENPRQLLQSVIRAFRIAEMLAEEGELGVTEIDGRLGIDKSTAYRILATLREMVVFKNTRDTGEWPAPDVKDNMTSEIGNLGLSDQNVDDLVAFLMALTDL